MPAGLLSGLSGQVAEFALQCLEGGEDLGAFGSHPEERMPAKALVAEPRLRELLESGAEVECVDAYVALAPRAIAAKEGLGDVIRAEFVELLRGAKAAGRAVVLQLGGNNAHLLARKVYLRPAFTQFGLRCGYLRWRSGPQAA